MHSSKISKSGEFWTIVMKSKVVSVVKEFFPEGWRDWKDGGGDKIESPGRRVPEDVPHAKEVP